MTTTMYSAKYYGAVVSDVVLVITCICWRCICIRI